MIIELLGSLKCQLLVLKILKKKAYTYRNFFYA